MHTNTHACCLIDIQITFQSWIHTYLLCCAFDFCCFSLSFIVYGPCELASWKKFNSRSTRREKKWKKEKIATTTAAVATTNHQAVIVCTGDCQFLTSCFYWNFSICNYTWTFGTPCTLIIIIFFSLLSIASFNQPFKITVHLPPHTRLYKSLQSSIVKKRRNKQQIPTIPSLNIAFTNTHQRAFACIQMCTHEHKHTRTITNVSYHTIQRALAELRVWARDRVLLFARVCVCCCCVYFPHGFKMKVNQSCAPLLLLLLLCVCIGCLSLFFFQSLFGLSLSNSFIWFDFFPTFSISFFQWISFFILFAHTKHNTLIDLNAEEVTAKSFMILLKNFQTPKLF